MPTNRMPRVLLLAALATAGACSNGDAPARLLAPTGPARLAAPGSVQATADDVARALALALRRPDVRAQVRGAMRASRMTEHKLVLQEFVATPAGRRVVETAAEQAGIGGADLLARIAALPLLDFYAPFVGHRKSWRGTADILVGATMDPHTPLLTAFRTDGSPLVLDGRDGVPALPLLVLHPAERKGVRAGTQPDGPGDVIQDAGDGETSGAFERAGGDARTSGGILTSPGSTCSPTDVVDCGAYQESPYPVPAYGDTTFVDFLSISYGDGFWGGDCEIELRGSYYPSGSTSATDHGTYRMEGVHPMYHYYPHKPLMLKEIRAGSGDRIHLRVIETDVLFDDDKKSEDFFEGHRGRQVAITSGSREDGEYIHELQTVIELDWLP